MIYEDILPDKLNKHNLTNFIGDKKIFLQVNYVEIKDSLTREPFEGRFQRQRTDSFYHRGKKLKLRTPSTVL